MLIKRCFHSSHVALYRKNSKQLVYSKTSLPITGKNVNATSYGGWAEWPKIADRLNPDKVAPDGVTVNDKFHRIPQMRQVLMVPKRINNNVGSIVCGHIPCGKIVTRRQIIGGDKTFGPARLLPCKFVPQLKPYVDPDLVHKWHSSEPEPAMRPERLFNEAIVPSLQRSFEEGKSLKEALDNFNRDPSDQLSVMQKISKRFQKK